MNPKRKKDWFKPLVTSSYDGDGLHIEFGYEGSIFISNPNHELFDFSFLIHSALNMHELFSFF